MEQLITNGFLYKLFYNILIGITDLLPGASIALAVIALTLLVKIILIPLTYRSIKSQIQQKKLQPLLSEIRKKYADDQKKQSEAILQLYKDHKTNPFAGCFLIIIQIIVIIPLYYVFLKLDIYPELLYGFISAPEALNEMFLGVNLAQQSMVFAALAGLSQFAQLYWSPAMKEEPVSSDEPPTAQEEMMKGMQKSMKYTMPIMITVVAYIVPAAVALYWIVSNLFTIAQEINIRKKLEKNTENA
ncbi:MAG: YidC/Oxa1 family membrane protein insertase [Candidatus Pacebacteria bacterium]|nr:YidC/Oxa1 family membrane protein insertase [Candidatus Paceibacterota bacterium]MCD8528027.1 YidC/Oxa1 family membrane protein insertase [Candidatus Paceibacterota bacterium]MCD8563891.1 YidC/Oxa1 family membrane protein insertase [Candidatus Paceibacterota bacterium]